MRVLIRKIDNRIIEAQSGTAKDQTVDVLIDNAASSGIEAKDVTSIEMDDHAFAVMLKAQSDADNALKPVPTKEEKVSALLARAGLTLADLKAVLAAK